MSYSAVLRIRAFRDLWLGQAISMLGDSFYFVIFAFMVNKVTGSVAMVGTVAAVEMLPYLLLSPYAGVLADRLDRKQIMLLSDLVAALILVIFASVVIGTHGKPPVWLLITTAASLSTIRCFFMPAKNAAIPNLVPAELLPQANGLNGMTQSIMPMISLSLSATIISILFARSPGTFFASSILVNAISFLASAIFIARLPKILPDRDKTSETHVLTDLRDGFRYVRSRRVLWVSLVLQLMLTLSISPFFVVYVAANNDWFGGKPSSLAWFECSFFVGLVLSNMVVGKMNLKRPGQGFIWSLSAVGLFVVGMAFSRTFCPFVIWQFACGLAIPFVDIPMTTWRQTAIPDEYRGRYNSLLAMVQNGAMPIGLSLAGQIIASLGLVNAFVVMGTGMFLASLAGLLDREFRNLRIEESVAVTS